MEADRELSEGEVVEEEADTSTNGDRQDVVEPPRAKKRKLADDAGEEGWESLSKKQLKKRMKKREREKKLHQEIENRLMTTSHASDSAHLNARQAEVVSHLVSMVSGDQPDRATLEKIKTIQFQSLVSHLVTGSPSLGEPLRGVAPSEAEKLCSDYKVVVVWLSMVSSDFFRKHDDHFASVKKLSPSVMFDIEHPGSFRFVKLGLESFMMLASGEDGHAPPSSSVARATDDDKKKPPRYAYLFTTNELSDNDFPTPRPGGVDQLGRDVASYVSIVEWPGCEEVRDAPQVNAAAQERATPGENEGDADMPMFAIDCEMVETRVGSELARISIVNEALECVYDTYVKPECPVVDYRTRYSGVSETTLEDITTTLKDVQTLLPSHLPPNSILVGHSLENDFHAMKFKHPFVIDTSCIFTPLATPTGKPGLRKLCKELLAADIQNTDRGHDSIEDATACMKLVKLKLEKGERCKIAFNEIAPSIFSEYRTRGRTTGIVDKESVMRLFGRGSTFSAEASNDEAAVSQSASIISSCNFTFVQLHSMEYLLKSENGTDKGKIEETARVMDSHVCKIVEACPSKTLVFLACGSGDIRKVRRIQVQDMPDMQLLKKEVMLARTGCVVGVIVP